MLGLLIIIIIVYIIYVLHKWDEKAEKKFRELEKNTFQKMNYYELMNHEEFFNKSKTPKLDKYINEIMKDYEKISVNEEKKYLKKIKNGCHLSLLRFVKKKLYNVIEIVNKLNKNGLHPELIDVGIKALIESCKSFNGEDNFDKYSYKIISNYITEELKDNKIEYSTIYEEKSIRYNSRICLTCRRINN